MQLKNGPKTSREIEEALSKSQSTISQQLKILLQGNIIQFIQEVVKKTYSIKSPQIYSLLNNIGAFMTALSEDKMSNMNSFEFTDILS